MSKKVNIFYRFSVAALLMYCSTMFSVTNSLSTSGAWLTTTNWSLGHIPLNTEDVVIPSNKTVTIDGAGAVCASLTIGDNGSQDATITITGPYILSVTTAGGGSGNLTFNPNNKPKVYTISVGTGTLIVDGVVTGGAGGGNKGGIITVSSGSVSFTKAGGMTWGEAVDITVSGTGSVSFTGALALNNATGGGAATATFLCTSSGSFTFNGLVTLQSTNNIISNTTVPGTVSFNAGLNLSAGGSASLVTMAGETINIASVLTVSTTALTFDPGSNVIFTAAATVTPTAAITFGNVEIASGAWTLAGNVTIAGNWYNSGGTTASSGGTRTITFTGNGKTIDGTVGTLFNQNIIIATGANYTMEGAYTYSAVSLTFNSSATVSSLTHGTLNPVFNISGNVTVNQPSASFITGWYINGGSSTVTGTCSFVGTNTTAGRISKISVTSGALTVTSAFSFAANTAVANQVLEVTGSGTITLSTALTHQYGTISVGSSGTFTFNGAAPSYTFSPAALTQGTLTTVSGSTINIKTGITCATTALTFANGSTEVITGSGTVTPTAAITFGNVQINATFTLTLAGSISVTNNWTNLGGPFTPSTHTVTFNGTSTQTVSATSGSETFYNVTSNTTGPITLASGTNVIVTNLLTMTAGLYNLNGQTLTLGTNGVASTLTRTASATTNWMYGGTFKRFWLSGVAVSSTAGNFYGLFPLGASYASSYRPLEIDNSAGNPTSNGYFTANHADSYLTTALVPTCDDAGTPIVRISNAQFITTISGEIGGTYTIKVTMTGLLPGTASDIRLAVFTGGTTAAVVGTHSANLGTAPNPTVVRTGITSLVADFNRDFRVSTVNATATPIRDVYYSIANGTWGTSGVWSYSSGGASCACVPSTSGYVIIENGNIVTTTAPVTVDYLDIKTSGSTLNDAFGFTINRHLFTSGSGIFSNTAGTFTISGDLITAGTGSSSVSALTVAGNLNVGSGTTVTVNTSSTFSGNITVDGTLSLGATNSLFNGASGSTISGSGTVSGSGTITITNNKSIVVGTNLTLVQTVAISPATTITNNGTITLSGNLTGANGTTSIWTNAASSTLNAAGAVLATGVFNASDPDNVVQYNGAGAQAIKNPASSSYQNLIIANAGTKSMGADLSISIDLTISGAAILDAVSYTLNGGGNLTMSGTSKLYIQKNGSVTYPELTGSYFLTGGSVHLDNTGGNPIVRGRTFYDLILDNSRNFDCSLVTSITNNLTMQGSSRMTANGVLTIGNTFTMNSSAGTATALTNNVRTSAFILTLGTLADGGYTIEVDGAGGWTKNGGTFTATGTTSFIGTVAQGISGTSSTTFKNLIINNSSATGVTLAQPITVTTLLNMLDGNLFTDATNLITISNGGASSPGSSISFVDGPMKKIGNAAFIFPIGDNTVWARLGISAPSTATTQYTAQYFLTPYADRTVDATLTDVSGREYWTLAQAVNNDDVKITLYWEDATASGIDDCADLELAHYTGVDFVLEDATIVGGSSCTGAGTGSVITNANVATYSPFTFGSRSGAVNPLPIQLLSFTAKLNSEEVVDLNWITATEVNNDYFTIERSSDGFSFSELKNVDGAGNSSVKKEYSTVDPLPLPGTSYYRLKQTDFDGKFAYSKIVPIELVKNGSFFIVYPNPTDAGTAPMLKFITDETKNILVLVTDAVGKEIFSKVTIVEKGDDQVVAIDPSNTLPAGVYIISASSDNSICRQKLIIR